MRGDGCRLLRLECPIRYERLWRGILVHIDGGWHNVRGFIGYCCLIRFCNPTPSTFVFASAWQRMLLWFALGFGLAALAFDPLNGPESLDLAAAEVLVPPH